MREYTFCILTTVKYYTSYFTPHLTNAEFFKPKKVFHKLHHSMLVAQKQFEPPFCLKSYPCTILIQLFHTKLKFQYFKLFSKSIQLYFKVLEAIL